MAKKTDKRQRIPVRFPADGHLYNRLKRVVFELNARDVFEGHESLNDFILVSIERRVKIAERSLAKNQLRIQEVK